MVANANSNALRRCGLEVRSESTRSRCNSRARMRRLRSASARLASGDNSEVDAFGAEASACRSSMLFDSQPLDIALFYPFGFKASLVLPAEALLPAETIDHSDVEADIVLNRASVHTDEIGCNVRWRKAQRKIWVEVVVGAHA